MSAIGRRDGRSLLECRSRGTQCGHLTPAAESLEAIADREHCT